MKHALLLSAILVMMFVTGSSTLAQSPPQYYSAYFDNNGYYLSGTGTGTSFDGLWTFNFAAPPAAHLTTTGGCPVPPWICENESWITYLPGGSFVLTGPDGRVFNGQFYGGGHFYQDIYDWYQFETVTDILSIQATGQWNNGLLQGAWLDQEYITGVTAEASLVFGAPPTPEPGTEVLMASGLALIAFHRRLVAIASHRKKDRRGVV